MIDIILLLAIILGSISVVEVGGLAYSAYQFSDTRVEKKIQAGVTRTLADPKFQASVVRMMLSRRTVKLLSKGIMYRVQAMFDGLRGYDAKTKKKFFETVTQDGDVSQVIGMLPKKTQEMIGKNPWLIELGLPIIKELASGYMQRAIGGTEGES